QEINQFQLPFGGYSLNFSIPINWIRESTEVWNGTDNKTSQCIIREVNNKFREVRVFPAGNGTNWYLIANSTNLLSVSDGIKPHMNGKIILNSSLSYNICFNASFNQNLLEDNNPNDIENITLYIYNPDNLGNQLNYTSTNKTHPSGKEFFLSEWNVTETNTTIITEDLEFRIQIFWFNFSAAAFIEKNFTIIAHENQTLLQDFGKEYSIRRGEKITYQFNYTLDEPHILIKDAFLLENHVHEGYIYNFMENANGNYSLKINTSNVNVSGDSHYLNFSVGKVGYKPQNFELKIDLGASNSSIIILSYNPNLKRADSNQTVQFYFNNCITNEPILGVDTSDIQVFGENGTIWGRGFGDHNWTLFNGTQPGYYYLNISVKGLDAAKYYLTIKINKTPNFNFAEAQIEFFIDGNESLMIILWTYDPLGKIYPEGLNNYYNCFEGGDLTLFFYVIDTDFDDEIITEVDETLDISVYYQGISNNEIEGGLKNNITFYQESNLFIGTIKTSALKGGTYLINISVTLKNYDIKPYIFNLSINSKLRVNMTEITIPKNIMAGEQFTIYLKLEYFTGKKWLRLQDADVYLVVRVNNELLMQTRVEKTNANGTVGFWVIIPINAENFSFDVHVNQGYYYREFYISNIEIKVISCMEFLISTLISFNLVIGGIIGGLSLKEKNIIFHSKEKIHVLKKYQFITRDVSNLKSILIIDVKSNKPLYFRNINKTEISIKEFLNLINFNHEFKKDKITLHALEVEKGLITIYQTDSFKVALFTEKRTQTDFSLNVFKDFCTHLEKIYNEQGILDDLVISNLVNEKLFLSYLLPYSINPDLKKEIDLKNKTSKKILELTRSLSKTTSSRSFFIIDLIEYIVNRSKLDLTRILLEIDKFLNKKIIISLNPDN
ncbi:MAG: hypothetical protein ACTSXH_07725, partial [Promethearchaeota archaeon]